MQVYFKVYGEARLPYGARGHRKHKGPKRSLVDFGKRGTWRIRNDWLSEKKPDPIFGEAAKVASGILKEMGISLPQ